MHGAGYGALLGAAAGLSAAPLLRGAVARYAVPEEQPWAVCCPGVPLALPTARCVRCRARRGPLPGSVEAAAAVLGAAVGWAASWPTLPVVAWFAALAVVLAFVDGAVHRLPDPLTALLAVGTAVLAVVGQVAVEHHPAVLLRCLLAGGALGLLFLVMAMVAPVGLGDVKLAPSVGVLLGLYGWSAVLAGFVYLWFIAALWVVGLWIAGRARRGTEIAIGPFMLAGALLAALAGG